MPLPPPILDNRTHQQLLDMALARLRQLDPAWDDRSAHVPAAALLDVFADMTELLLARVNHIPDQVYLTLLRLLGVTLTPPSAAVAVLCFRRARGHNGAIRIPRGTRVTVAGDSSPERPIFVTIYDETLGEGMSAIDVLAYNAEAIDAEDVGAGTDHAVQSLQVQYPPIIHPTGDARDLVVAVEMADGEHSDHVPEIWYDGTPYRVWQEVETLAQMSEQGCVYIVDRHSGTIVFAPCDDGDSTTAPRLAGRRVRVWYRRGGGSAGNLPAHTLTVLLDPIAGVLVTNEAPAAGGRDAETLESALRRGPRELRSLDRAVTAADYELIALRTAGVARAHAYTQAELHTFATPGTVAVILVPEVPATAWPNGHLPQSTLEAHTVESVREAVRHALDERRPLGTNLTVQWAKTKSVSVHADIVVQRDSDATAVRRQVQERLFRTLNPLPDLEAGASGWPFGQPLSAAIVEDIIMSVPGVRRVANVSLRVPDTPRAIAALAADHFQPSTWYAASGNRVYKTQNDGLGWEVAVTFGEGENVDTLESHPTSAGWLAAVTRSSHGDGSRVFVSRDCGDSWENVTNTGFQVEDIAWVPRNHAPVLLLASDAGLFEMTCLHPHGEISRLLVDAGKPKLGFCVVTVAIDNNGVVSVAAAAQNGAGVYLSTQAGRANTFRLLNGAVDGQDVRVLAIQRHDARTWLWAGTSASGAGGGCFRREVRGDGSTGGDWVAMHADWQGGNCHALAFVDGGALAATAHGGVLYLNPDGDRRGWLRPGSDSGLPASDSNKGRFAPVMTVATNPAGTLALAGGVHGVFSVSAEVEAYRAWRFAPVSANSSTDAVTLPPTWLLTSAEHEITVVSDDEAG